MRNEYYNISAATLVDDCSNVARHSALHAWLSKSRDHKRATLFRWQAEDGEELDDTSLTEGFFDKIHGDAPPREDCTDDPEIRRGFHSRDHARAVGEKTAGNSRSNRQSRQHTTQDEVARARGQGLPTCVIEMFTRTKLGLGFAYPGPRKKCQHHKPRR